MANELVSSAASNPDFAIASYATAISANGRYVVFQSNDPNVVPNDTNGVNDIFVKDMVTGIITRVSTDALGVQGNGDSGGGDQHAHVASISADGRFVVFQSDADNLVPSDINAAGSPVPDFGQDVFVKDLQTGAITRISTDALGGQANGFSGTPSMSADGRFIAFESSANNLGGGTNPFVVDVFVKDMQTGAITLVSSTGLGEANNSSGHASISADGHFVGGTNFGDYCLAGVALGGSQWSGRGVG